MIQDLRLRQSFGQQRHLGSRDILCCQGHFFGGLMAHLLKSEYPPSQYRREWVSQSVLLHSQSRNHPGAVQSPSWSLVASLQHSSRLSDTPASHLKGANIMSGCVTQAAMLLSHSSQRMLPGGTLLLGKLAGSVNAPLPQY